MIHENQQKSRCGTNGSYTVSLTSRLQWQQKQQKASQAFLGYAQDDLGGTV